MPEKIPLVVFDIESSDYDMGLSGTFLSENRGLDLRQEFLRASSDPAEIWKHPLFRAHDPGQIIQLFTEGAYKEKSERGWTKINPRAGWSAFAREHGFKASSERLAKMTEAEVVGQTYQHLASQIALHGQVQFGGHHSDAYDLWGLERATYRHEELKPYRGWLAARAKDKSLVLRDSDREFLEGALAYAKTDPDFAAHHLRSATTPAAAARVPGHSVVNLAEGLDYRFAAHDAFEDVGGTRQIFNKLVAGQDAEYLKKVLPRGEAFVENVLASEVKAVAAAKPAAMLAPEAKRFLKYGIAGAAGAALIGSFLAFSTRRDRQTQITGLRDEGMAVRSRHSLTSFGSGWQGIDPQLESEDAYNPFLRALGVGVVGSALYGAHRYMLATEPGYAPKLSKWAKAFEEYSPGHLGRTFGISDRLSSYIPEKVIYTRADLTSQGIANSVGSTLERQFKRAGIDFNILRDVTEANPLTLGDRKAGSAYLRVLNRPGIDAEVRVGASEGRQAGTASRLGQELTDSTMLWSTDPNMRKRIWENTQRLRHSQRISNASPFEEASKLGDTYRPIHIKAHLGPETWHPLQAWRNLSSQVELEGMGALERMQNLSAEIGMGLHQGRWNKPAHVPFIGEGGMVNQVLTKRVLPVVVGATALGWLDYHLGHPSNVAINLGLKANVLHADLTDMLPGGRSITDLYEHTVPGPQYGPLAIPAMGAFAGGLYHYSNVLRGKFPLTEDGEKARKLAARILPDMEKLREWTGKGNKLASVEGLAEIWKNLGAPGKGAAIGLAVMLPFVPGMLGSRKKGNELRDIYSGEELVPVRSGRWWEVGSTAFEGARIKEWRPHWSILHKSHAEDAALYGSEAEKWKHNPILHPVRYLRDPYFLEEKHYRDRPYPVSSPAFTNVPLIGPLLAATIGRVVKPVVRMHEEEWDGTEYSLYSPRLEPRGPDALPPPKPKDEYSLGNVFGKEANIFAEYTGLYGFVAKSAYQGLFPNTNSLGKEVDYQGSRQIDNFSRRYYEKELGAGVGPSLSGTEHFGYTEPFRRFVQNELFTPQANEIPNAAPSWLPGDDYYTNFHEGDPFLKVPEGYARLPGAGYEALHPELKDVNPEDYPDIHKMAILADVAPYSREYNTYRQRVGKEAQGNTELEIEYEKILNRVKKTRESVIRMQDRHFTAPVDEISGTVEEVSPGGIILKEYPGRLFQFSSVSTSAADMSARILGEENNMTRSEVAEEVDRRRLAMRDYLTKTFSDGEARLVIPKGAADSAEAIRAVILAGGENVNRELIDQGYGQYREDLGGAEARAMHGALGRQAGRLAEGLSFQGDAGILNPMHYLPSPAHTKLWQERTPLAQYINNEVVGTRMRRWQRPIHDFLMPYMRGIGTRLTGGIVVPEEVQRRRDLNTLADQMTYLREMVAEGSGTYTNKGQRSSIGANQFTAPTFVASTLPARESHYFREFLQETDPDKRERILEVTSPEMQRTLSTQWIAQEARIAEAEGRDPGEIGEGGRLYTKAALAEYEGADTKLGYGNWLRSKEIADFFSRTGFTLPDAGSAAFDEALDYKDVELKIVQQEGYDGHDFNLFDDRASVLWRKPYLDGAVRELTSGEDRSPEELRRVVEQMMLNAKDKMADVRAVVHAGHGNHANIHVHVDIDQTDELINDLRRNPDKYDEE